MDFALDFQPLNNQRNNNMRQAEMNAQMNRDNMMNNQNVATKGVEKNINNQSPVVKLSIEKEDMKNNIDIQRQNNEENMNNINQQLIQQKPKDEIGQVINDTINTLSNTKVIKKKVEIITTITYTYEDGSTKVITQNQSHEFNN